MDKQNVNISAPTERESFMSKLLQFHSRLGTPIKRIPMLGGRELDVFHLFNKVQSLGGSKVVQDNRLWGEVARSFNLPSSVTSASYAVRQHYLKLLEKYEYYLEDPIANDPSRTPVPHPTIQLPWKPMIIYPPTPPVKPSSTVGTSQNKGELDSVKINRLIRSLQSGYPNEVDFAFNTLTILSYDLWEEFHLDKLPHLMAAMLAHVAVFSEDDPGLESMYHDCWHSNSTTDYIQFWELTVPEWVFVPVLHSAFTKASYYPSLFNPHTLPTEDSIEGHRVSQLVNILRNLSFCDTCAKYFAGHNAVQRFLLLCSNNCLPSIKTSSLDTLANLAPHTTLPTHSPHTSHTPHTSELLLGTLFDCIQSQDRLAIVRGLEILGDLTMCPSNNHQLLTTPTNIFTRIFHLLLLPDCQILLSSLESLYNLSFISREMALKILSVERSCQVLVNLLTIRTERFDPKKLARLKLTEKKANLLKSQTVQPIKTSSFAMNLTPLRSQNLGNVISKTGSNLSIPTSKSLKIGNSAIPTIQGINLTNKLQGQPTFSPHNKTMGQNFIPILTVQQLQDLLVKTVPGMPKLAQQYVSQSGGHSLAGSNVRVNLLLDKGKPHRPSSMPAVTTVGQSSKVESLTFQSPKDSVTTVQATSVTTTPTIQTSSNSQTSKPVSSTSVNAPTKSLPATSDPAMLGSTPLTSSVDHNEITKQWLSGCYEESSGCYVSPLEMYSLYMRYATENGLTKIMNLTDFNNTIRKVFPNSLSTKITVAGTVVYMIAGLAKKTTPTSNSRDSVVTMGTSSQLGEPAKVGQPISLDAIRGPTSTAMSNTGLTSSTSSQKVGVSQEVGVACKSIGVQATTRALITTTPSLKSTGQRSDSRSASPLTVSRRALDLATPEVKGQTCIENSTSFTNLISSESSTDQIIPPAKRICLESKQPATVTNSNHIGMSELAPGNDTLSVEGIASNGLVSGECMQPVTLMEDKQKTLQNKVSLDRSLLVHTRNEAMEVESTPRSLILDDSESTAENKHKDLHPLTNVKPSIPTGATSDTLTHVKHPVPSRTPPDMTSPHTSDTLTHVKHPVPSRTPPDMTSPHTSDTLTHVKHPVPSRTPPDMTSPHTSDTLTHVKHPVPSRTPPDMTSPHTSDTLTHVKHPVPTRTPPDMTSPHTSDTLTHVKHPVPSRTPPDMTSPHTSDTLTHVKHPVPSRTPPDMTSPHTSDTLTHVKPSVPSRTPPDMTSPHTSDTLTHVKHPVPSRTPPDMTSPHTNGKLSTCMESNSFKDSGVNNISATNVTNQSLTSNTNSLNNLAQFDSNTLSIKSSTNELSKTHSHSVCEISKTHSNSTSDGSDELSSSSGSSTSLTGSTKSAESSKTDLVSAVMVDQGSKVNLDEAMGTSICLWSNCTSVRPTTQDLFYHVVYDHLPLSTSYPLVCAWQGCSNKSKRMKPSMLRHVQTHHCSPVPPPSPPNIAKTLAKIKHIPPLTDETENYVTKAIHLTAALVVRNILRACPEAKQKLLPYEHRLSQIALSTCEASTAVAQCLHLLHNDELP